MDGKIWTRKWQKLSYNNDHSFRLIGIQTVGCPKRPTGSTEYLVNLARSARRVLGCQIAPKRFYTGAAEPLMRRNRLEPFGKWAVSEAF